MQLELAHILKISLVIVGIHTCFLEGMIFSFLNPWILKLPEWINKPLCKCVMCMASLWTIIEHIIRHRPLLDWYHHSWWTGIPYPAIDLMATMLAVCGFNTLMDSMIQFYSRQPLEEFEEKKPEE